VGKLGMESSRALRQDPSVCLSSCSKPAMAAAQGRKSPIKKKKKKKKKKKSYTVLGLKSQATTMKLFALFDSLLHNYKYSILFYITTNTSEFQQSISRVSV
jgi:hypothetical protein